MARHVAHHVSRHVPRAVGHVTRHAARCCRAACGFEYCLWAGGTVVGELEFALGFRFALGTGLKSTPVAIKKMLDTYVD